MVVNKEQALTRRLAHGVSQKHYLDKGQGAGAISMGVVTIDPGCKLIPHFHHVEDAMIVLKGTGLVWIDDVSEPINANCAVMVPAGKKHYLENTGKMPLVLVYAWPAVEVERYVCE